MNKIPVINIIGTLLILASLYFVFYEFWSNRTLVLKWQPGTGDIILFLLCALGYGLSQFLLSGAWSRLLLISGQDKIDLKECHKLYGQTQIAKYIPGNIFHYAGRYIIGKSMGFDKSVLITSTILEAICLLIVASALSLSGVLFFGLEQENISSIQLMVILVLSVCFVFSLYIIAPRIIKLSNHNIKFDSFQNMFLRLKSVFLMQSVFFLFSGLALVLIVVNQTETVSLEVAGIIIVVSIASWIIGFVTPGAPAGVGVRDAIIVFSLTQFFDSYLAVMAALIYRMVTVVGDIVFYLVTRALTLKD